MQATLVHLDSRIDHLEMWRTATEAAREAVEKYKASEAKGGDRWVNKELLKALGIALGAIVGLVAYLRTL